MAIQIVKDNQYQVAWERDPSEYAEGVTLSHSLHYRGTCRVEEYTGTALALIKAGLCTEAQFPHEHSVQITYAPDGSKKRTVGAIASGTLRISRKGRKFFRCERFIALTTQETEYLDTQEKKYQEYLQLEQEKEELKRKELGASQSKTYYELMVDVFNKSSDEMIDRVFQTSRETFLDTEKAMLYVKEQRRKAIAESDGVVIYPKIWQHA